MSPGSWTLFKSAIIGSNVATGPFMYVDREQQNGMGIALAKQVGCQTESSGRGNEITLADIVDCLRGTNVDELVKKQWNIAVPGPSFAPRFLPTIDGTFLKKKPQDIVAANEFASKSVILGFDANEGNYFVLLEFPGKFDATKDDPQSVNETEFRTIVSAMSPMNPSQTAAAAFEYLVPCDGATQLTDFYALSNIFGDRVFKFPLIDFADDLADWSTHRSTNFSVYMYKFAQPNKLPFWARGSTHGDELDFIFGLPYQQDYYDSYSDEDRTLSDRMIRYLTNFAKTRNPNMMDDGNPDAVVDWPVYSSSQQTYMVLNVTSLTSDFRPENGFNERKHAFWNILVPQLADVTPSQTSGAVRTVGMSLLVAVLLFAVRLIFE
jgi:carboxylesterase type B